jgi:hypothetical protein
MIRDVFSGSRTRIPDLGVNKAPDPDPQHFLFVLGGSLTPSFASSDYTEHSQMNLLASGNRFSPD